MTKNNSTLHQQIQFMKELQKPIAMHSVTVKDLMKHNVTRDT